ncbi:hypothetical protein [Flavivirga eckloniae]|uniref:Lipocalin-like domain-containing protein n=1 Tax=Flavivirga eckloniae TaxID=1803846 RepID=A0A2K9PLD8_9FLAO|nr:hypothetical protein [Flavivirga eckloniae]AUP77881.1 hypothetical protein C1H87_03795 [Flavivirga eckloniae]
MKKKKVLFIGLFSLLVFTSCSINDSPNPDPRIRVPHWHLIKTTGGIAGVDHEFPLETVIWTFDDANSKLMVVNKNTDDTKQDAFDAGTYPFSIKKVDDKTFLIINEDEFGEFEIDDKKRLIINQNNLSEGTGADGFVYTFHRTIEIITP